MWKSIKKLWKQINAEKLDWTTKTKGYLWLGIENEKSARSQTRVEVINLVFYCIILPINFFFFLCLGNIFSHWFKQGAYFLNCHFYCISRTLDVLMSIPLNNLYLNFLRLLSQNLINYCLLGNRGFRDSDHIWK